MWCAYSLDYYLAIYRKDIFPFATVWVNLDDVIQSAISQQKTNRAGSHLHEESEIIKLKEKTGVRIWLPGLQQ